MSLDDVDLHGLLLDRVEAAQRAARAKEKDKDVEVVLP
jgi:hypothetical protein